MYILDLTDAEHVLVASAFVAQQRLDLVPRLLVDVAGAVFLAVVLLFIGLTVYGAAHSARSAGGAYRPRHARPRSYRGAGSSSRRPRTGLQDLTTG